MKILKSRKFIYTFILLCVSLCIGMFFIPKMQTTANAETTSDFDYVFKHITFASEDMIYNEENFDKSERTNSLLSSGLQSNMLYLGALYTNTSFAKNDDFNAKLSDLQKQINELKNL